MIRECHRHFPLVPYDGTSPSIFLGSYSIDDGKWHYVGMSRVNGDLALFETAPKVPDGFIYRPGFISEAQEQEFISEIQKLNLTAFKYYQFTGKRRTASFGWQYEFGDRDITRAFDIPAFLLAIRTRGNTFQPRSGQSSSSIHH
jgi:hypothetical protein